MKKQTTIKRWGVCHLLMTSLFYPAILGTLFFSFLEDCCNLTQNTSRLPVIFAFVGILINFSIDYLYTWTSKKSYNIGLFVCDLAILLLLVNAYRSLVDGIASTGSIKIFFISFVGIHSIFLLWDLFIIAPDDKPNNVIGYDAFSLLISILGLGLSSNPMSGVVMLWIFAIGAMFNIGGDIIRRINDMY